MRPVSFFVFRFFFFWFAKRQIRRSFKKLTFLSPLQLPLLLLPSFTGAAGVHFEDQLSSEKKCGHLGGKVLVPTSQFVRSLVAARLAADVSGVPTILIARTDALGAGLLTSDVDPVDRQFCTGERTPEGFFRVNDGIKAAIAR